MDWPILAGLGEDERRRVLQASRRRTFARHEVVYHRGDPADTVHLVLKGRFAVKVVTPLGDTATLSIVRPGELFGELALLDDAGHRTATVVAVEPAETRALRKADFDALRRREPQVGDVLVVALAHRVERLSELLVEALYVPADVRVLRRVRELCALYSGNGGPCEVPLTQEELSELAGTSRATVNRVLREAERRGEIELRRGRLAVVDAAAVARRSGAGG